MSRRDFLSTAGGTATALCLGLELAACDRQTPGASTRFADPVLAAYLEITADNLVHIVTPAAEMGQGDFTVLPLILADELGANWETVQVRQSWADERFINPGKNLQATGRSMSVRGYYDHLRKLAAAARQMLCQAAAARWATEPAMCEAVDGFVRHRSSGERLAFADLIDAASRLTVPDQPVLKRDAELRWLGRDVPRKDIPPKVAGQAQFGIDVQLPDMLVATVRAAPVFGSVLEGFDASAAEAMPGVHAVVALDNAVAVVAETFWQANNGLATVEVRFAATPNDGVSSAQIRERLVAALDEPGLVAVENGDVEAVSSEAPALLYEVPYLAHATMEPMCCTAQVTEAGCELWIPTQGPIRVRDRVAEALALAPEQVRVNRTYVAGGFGRRWQYDFGVQAALIARAVGRPVKLIWSREEDMRQDFYRPTFVMRARGSLGNDQAPAVLDVKLAGPSIGEWGRPGRLQGQVDRQSVGGFNNSPYAIPNYRVRWVSHPTHVPIGVWRSVAYSHNAFFRECLLDEMAAAAGEDPLELRLSLLSGNERWRQVLNTAAERAGWGQSLPRDEGLGIAANECYGGIVAQIAHVRLRDSELQILRMVCAADCGRVLQPGNVRAQMEGGIVFGLSAALYGQIDIQDGAVVQDNYSAYRMVTLRDCPDIEVHLVEGSTAPGGVGEPGTPPAAPALVNAIFAATGQRIRSLPLTRHGFV
jgi:isoquinoline 1-oxidoreductase beta subunit